LYNPEWQALMSNYLFISHAAEDAPLADEIARVLEAAGARCWMAPRDIIPSSSWSESIVAAIEASRLMVVLLTGRSVVSPHVTREIGLAIDGNVPVVPVRVRTFRSPPPSSFTSARRRFSRRLR
jgi:hypothetical protein